MKLQWEHANAHVWVVFLFKKKKKSALLFQRSMISKVDSSLLPSSGRFFGKRLMVVSATHATELVNPSHKKTQKRMHEWFVFKSFLIALFIESFERSLNYE